nr:HDIG domain-containing protein [Opitutales bacterium]
FLFWILFFSLILSVICFFGKGYPNMLLIPGNLSKTRIVADIPFEYESKIKTERLREQRKQQARNVYEIDDKKYNNFIQALKMLDEKMESFSYEQVLTEKGRNELKEFTAEFSASTPIKVEWQDVALLISSLGQIERTQVLQECVSMLREIARDGVFYNESFRGDSFSLYGFRIKGRRQQRVRTQEGALHYIRMHLLSMDLDKDIVAILFKILKQGIRPNLVYDAEESKVDINLIMRSVKPVMVHYAVGDVIVDQNVMIDPELYEAITAYQKALHSSSAHRHDISEMFLTKMFLALVAICLVFIWLSFFKYSPLFAQKRIIPLFALVFIQLLILRVFIQVGSLENLPKNLLFTYALYCIAPFMLGSALATLLFGAMEGLLVSLLTITIYTLMLSRPFDFFLVTMLACFSLVKFLKNVKLRSKIFVCTFYSGVVFAVSIIIHGIFSQLDTRIIACQAGAAFLMAFITAILTIMLFPVLEHLFSVCTDISLSKLADYTNPLLQQLQILAPGTYQHSLMVSNLAEQVADSIGANKVICKSAALFHDIGKITKPEYFIENQSNHINLHDQQTPYVSSLIIRNHVKIGVAIAESAKLPEVIIDVIREHHGTTVTQYFYNKARTEILGEIDTASMAQKDINRYLQEKLDISSFRYDGPRPRTKESAIIMLSDSIEAASRSLKKITHQNIENLIESIFAGKISDHQLDECPITIDELRSLKKAFSFTLLSMLHSRISYNNGSDYETKKA